MEIGNMKKEQPRNPNRTTQDGEQAIYIVSDDKNVWSSVNNRWFSY